MIAEGNIIEQQNRNEAPSYAHSSRLDWVNLSFPRSLITQADAWPSTAEPGATLDKQ